MNSPRRSFVVPLGVFVVFVVVGLAAGGVWFSGGQPSLSDALRAPDLSSESSTFAFEGIVNYVGPGSPATWVVDVFSVQVVSSTKVITNGIAVTAGVWAQIEAVKQNEGLQASSIALRRAPPSTLFDRITRIDTVAGQWQVGNTQIDLPPGLVVQGSPAVGSLAWVHGQRSATGIVADEIVVAGAEPDTIVIGLLEAVTQTTWLVDNVTVELDVNTVISGTPTVGQRVQVQGVETGPQRMQAVRAWVETGSMDEERVLGWLQRIEGTGYPFLWRVNRVDSPQLRQAFLSIYEDVVLDDGAAPAQPGAWLDIMALRQGAGFYRATSIVVLPRAPKREIVGLVETLPQGTLVGLWRIAGYYVDVSADTGILGAPEIGSLVWVQGTPDYGNILHAELIEVQSR